MLAPIKDVKFSLGTFRATDAMRELIDRVLTTGRLSYGPLCNEFETRFANMHSCAYGVLSNSGTSSLQVALQALKELNGWEDGDEVIVPALTFVATVNVVYHCRLKPILVDVDEYYALNPSLIERAITPKTRCIIPVHPFGQGADMQAISKIADAYGLKVVEDSCEAMFVKTGGRYVGSWSDVGCFSTYVAHIITGGVGGIAITASDELATTMRSLVNHGINFNQLPSGDTYDPTFLGRKFEFDRVGHSYRVTEMEAALLLPQLDEALQIKEARQYNAKIIDNILGEYDGELLLPKVRPNSEHIYMVYPIVMREQHKRPIMAFLRQEGIECRDMLPLTTQPCYRFKPFLYPEANRINQHGFYIGCHQDLTEDAFTCLQKSFEKWFDVGYADPLKDIEFQNPI